MVFGINRDAAWGIFRHAAPAHRNTSHSATLLHKASSFFPLHIPIQVQQRHKFICTSAQWSFLLDSTDDFIRVVSYPCLQSQAGTLAAIVFFSFFLLEPDSVGQVT